MDKSAILLEWGAVAAPGAPDAHEVGIVAAGKATDPAISQKSFFLKKNGKFEFRNLFSVSAAQSWNEFRKDRCNYNVVKSFDPAEKKSQRCDFLPLYLQPAFPFFLFS